MFILLGPLFLITAAGILVGFSFLLFKQTRRWSAYLLLCPFCASFLSFWLFWGTGLLLADQASGVAGQLFLVMLVDLQLVDVLAFMLHARSTDDYSSRRFSQPEPAGRLGGKSIVSGGWLR
jgi:hypothetical protein